MLQRPCIRLSMSLEGWQTGCPEKKKSNCGLATCVATEDGRQIGIRRGRGWTGSAWKLPQRRPRWKVQGASPLSSPCSFVATLALKPAIFFSGSLHAFVRGLPPLGPAIPAFRPLPLAGQPWSPWRPPTASLPASFICPSASGTSGTLHAAKKNCVRAWARLPASLDLRCAPCAQRTAYCTRQWQLQC